MVDPMEHGQGDERVVTALRAGSARVAGLFAPAGFGKTRRAKRYGAGFDSHIYYAVAAGDTAASAVALVADALDDVPPQNSTLITVDEAHRLADADLQALLAMILARVPDGARLLVVSDREPTFRLTRLEGADSVAVFRRAEMQVTLEDRDDPGVSTLNLGPRLATVLALSSGWPEVILFLARLARENRLDAAMCDASSPSMRELFDWIEGRVVDALPHAICNALIYASASTQCTPEELNERHGDGVDVALYRDYQLADLGLAGEIRVLPILRHYFHQRRLGQIRDAAKDIAARYQRIDPIRAARAYINARLPAQAEGILSGLEFSTRLTLGDYAYPGTSLEVLAAAPPYTLYPLVWYGLVATRRAIVPPATLAIECEELIADSTTADRDLSRLIAVAALLRFESGDPRRARAHVATLRERLADTDPIIELVLMVDDLFSGQYRSCIDRWRRAHRSVLHAPSWFAWLGVYHARARTFLGEYDAVFGALEVLFSVAQRVPSLASVAAIEAAFVAFLWGDERAFCEYRSDAARIARYYDLPAQWDIVGSLYGLGPVPATQFEAMRAAYIHANIVAGHAGALPRTLLELAERFEALGLRIFARALVAHFEPQTRETMLDEAEALADSSDSTYLQRSVGQLRRGYYEDGAFRTLRGAPTQTRELPTSADIEPPLHRLLLDVPRLRILRNGEPLRVSERVLQLLVALAVSRAPLRREALADQLWPDLDGDAASSSLKMCVHRARQQVGDAEAIVVTSGTYALGPAVENDFFAIVSAAAQSYSIPLEAALQSSMEATFERLCEGFAVHGAPWPWLIPACNALIDAAFHLGERLFADARRGNELQRALHIARQMTILRPTIELPRLFLIQLHRDMGNAALARQAYTAFAAILAEQFGSAPTQALRNAVQPGG